MHLQDLEKTLSALHNDHVVSRIWNKDHTVWDSNNDVIQNSLGWLDISRRIREYIPSLKKFAHDVIDSGCEYVVLIGMGASSIGAVVPLPWCESSRCGYLNSSGCWLHPMYLALPPRSQSHNHQRIVCLSLIHI